jgi:beta-mannosidase
VVAELSNSGGGEMAPHNIVYIAPTREVHLKPATLTAQVTTVPAKIVVPGTRTFRVTISSPVLARDVYLSFGALDAQLSDNYFDILPGEKADVTISTNATLDQLKAAMKVVSLTDAFAAPSESATVTAAH